MWEDIRPGHLYLDLTGTRRLFGPIVDTAMRLERDVKQRHALPGVAGVATNKFVSRLAATLIVPIQLCDVRPGAEVSFVAPVFLVNYRHFRRQGRKGAGGAAGVSRSIDPPLVRIPSMNVSCAARLSSCCRVAMDAAQVRGLINAGCYDTLRGELTRPALLWRVRDH